MNRRILACALVASAVFFVYGAGSALATVTEVKTEKQAWEVGEKIITTSQSAKCSLKGEHLTIEGTVLGSELEITATGVECLESTIFNQAFEGGNMPAGSGKLKLTGVSVMKPAGCGISSTLTTNALKSNEDKHYEDGILTSRLIHTTSAATGETIVTITLTGCAAAGSYPLKGVAVGEGTVARGTLAKDQPVLYSAASNAAGTLTIGKSPAMITGEVHREMTSEEKFGVTSE